MTPFRFVGMNAYLTPIKLPQNTIIINKKLIIIRVFPFPIHTKRWLIRISINFSEGGKSNRHPKDASPTS